MSTPSHDARLGPSQRLMLALLGVLLLMLLALAAIASPNPQGYGTHTQLGFGECFVVRQWGVRCPSCGMTTAWAHLLNGNISSAVAANAGGAILCVLAASAVPWLLASSASGRWWYLRPTTGLLFPPFAAVALVVLLDWMRHTGLALIVEQLP